MNRFAALVERLEGADADTAARVLADYFASTPDPDRGAALGALLGATPLKRATPAIIRALAEERLDPALFDISREVAGDVAETVALMWPAPPRDDEDAPSVSGIVDALAAARTGKDAGALLARWFDRLGPAARVALVRLASGRLSGMLSIAAAHDALARLGGVPITDIEAVWHAAPPPYAALFAWLEGAGPRPPPDPVAPFHPLARAHPLGDEDRGRLALKNYAVERAWDGVRALAVAHGGTRRLYTRRGVDIAARVPEVVEALAFDGAIEGVLLARDAAGRISRAALDARLEPSRRPARRADEALVLRAADIITDRGVDVRQETFRARRAALEALFGPLAEEHASPHLELSNVHTVEDWEALDALRAEARASGARGMILKPWDSPYPGAGETTWRLWRCEPRRVPAVLLYLERAPEGAVATFGVWSGRALVPVARVALADVAAGEAVAAFAHEHAIDRFGPVLQVQADARVGLVAELVCDSVERAPRRKAGLTLRGAAVARILEDAAPSDAATLAQLEALLV